MDAVGSRYLVGVYSVVYSVTGHRSESFVRIGWVAPVSSAINCSRRPVSRAPPPRVSAGFRVSFRPVRGTPRRAHCCAILSMLKCRKHCNYSNATVVGRTLKVRILPAQDRDRPPEADRRGENRRISRSRIECHFRRPFTRFDVGIRESVEGDAT